MTLKVGRLFLICSVAVVLALMLLLVTTSADGRDHRYEVTITAIHSQVDYDSIGFMYQGGRDADKLDYIGLYVSQGESIAGDIMCSPDSSSCPVGTYKLVKLPDADPRLPLRTTAIAHFLDGRPQIILEADFIWGSMTTASVPTDTLTATPTSITTATPMSASPTLSTSAGTATPASTSLSAVTGSITIISVPDRSGVYLDGVYMGHTPNILTDLNVGVYALRLSKDGYHDGEMPIEIKEGDNGDISVGLIKMSVTSEETRTMDINVDEISLADFEKVDITQIKIDSKITAENVHLNVNEISNIPSNVPKLDRVYKYFDIKVSDVVNKDNVDNISIDFKVRRDWIEENNLDKDSIVMKRFHSEWEELSTKREMEDSEFIHYEAETPGFSIFVITAEPKTVETTALETITSPITAAYFIKPSQYQFYIGGVGAVCAVLIALLVLFRAGVLGHIDQTMSEGGGIAAALYGLKYGLKSSGEGSRTGAEKLGEGPESAERKAQGKLSAEIRELSHRLIPRGEEYKELKAEWEELQSRLSTFEQFYKDGLMSKHAYLDTTRMTRERLEELETRMHGRSGRSSKYITDTKLERLIEMFLSELDMRYKLGEIPEGSYKKLRKIALSELWG